MDMVFPALTWMAILGSALMAGVFFAFSTFVMDALAILPPAKGIAAMQSVNIVVVRSWFIGVFLATAVVALVLAGSAVLMWGDRRALYWLAGAMLYLIGTVGVTAAFNVPLNDALAAANPNSAEAASLWATYVTDWTWWNHVRTAAPLAATMSFILALK